MCVRVSCRGSDKTVTGCSYDCDISVYGANEVGSDIRFRSNAPKLHPPSPVAGGPYVTRELCATVQSRSSTTNARWQRVVRTEFYNPISYTVSVHLNRVGIYPFSSCRYIRRIPHRWSSYTISRESTAHFAHAYWTWSVVSTCVLD
jgi:hypothetical protein